MCLIKAILKSLKITKPKEVIEMPLFLDSKEDVRLPVVIMLKDFNPETDEVTDVATDALMTHPPLPFKLKGNMLWTLGCLPHNIFVRTNPETKVREYEVSWEKILFNSHIFTGGYYLKDIT